MKHKATLYLELFKRKEFELFTKGHEKQNHALTVLSDNETKELAYGGAAGGAKSWTGCVWLAFSCLAYSGTRYFIGREELTRLKESTLVTFFKVCSFYGIERDIDWKYNAQSHFIEFANESRISLLDLKYQPSDPYYERYGSVEYTSGWIEEAGEVNHGAFDTLKSRIGRHLNKEYNILSKMFITLNPKKNWCHERYWKPFKKNEMPDGIVFIPALVQDNPFIDTSYIENLHNISDKVKKQRLLFGNFDYDDDDDSLISFDKINDCFHNSFVETGDMFISSDIAITNDSFVVIVWDGLRIKELISLKNASKPVETMINGVTTTVVDYNPLIDTFERLNNKWKVSRSNICFDADGLGKNVKKYLSGAVPLHTGQKAMYPEYFNLKTELYYKLSDVINSNLLYFDCYIEPEQKERIISELQVIKRKSEIGEKLRIISKAEQKILLGHSPDIIDAMAYRMLFLITRRK